MFFSRLHLGLGVAVASVTVSTSWASSASTVVKNHQKTVAHSQKKKKPLRGLSEAEAAVDPLVEATNALVSGSEPSALSAAVQVASG
jgi:hypothetical protein